MAELTPKQQRFVREYVIDLNATQAAIRAGYSARNADKIGPRLVGKSRVRAAIDEALRMRAEATNITAERVLLELARIAFADARKLFDDDGALIPVHKLPDGVAASIASIEVVEKDGGHRLHKIRLTDKRGALELLGKHLALFVERLQISDAPDATVTDEPMSPDEWERQYATH